MHVKELGQPNAPRLVAANKMQGSTAQHSIACSIARMGVAAGANQI
jgi:hypothetical protein